ncbi:MULTISPECIES: GNAT family N-acetyltransferase [Vagococcus]|uniref:N-acetyltransferase domain-containing protein n=1 Tax=Vagococcus fluvialis bH819 TaxID=1255619 RepID=A0A1X6WNJ6_9ENTE|nr:MULTISPECIES: GNAT family N-acetyltransferase [Vagococcus]SLM85802.1 hypothetical protein FM121_06855 [Vagococcus fluvialis bH819]HCM90224.1 GNAT family N-acetyltransferase [Vagococcus sp.]
MLYFIKTKDINTYKIIGIISVSLAENGTFCEIGYTMNRQFWRQEITYEMLKELINLLTYYG